MSDLISRQVALDAWASRKTQRNMVATILDMTQGCFMRYMTRLLPFPPQMLFRWLDVVTANIEKLENGAICIADDLTMMRFAVTARGRSNTCLLKQQ